MDFFLTGPIPSHALRAVYNIPLVLLSYFIAVFASYVALEMTGRLQMEKGSFSSKFIWLFGGAVAMGAGIWAMHFIAMLAFMIPMENIGFDPLLTVASLLIAIVMSGFALFLLRDQNPKILALIFGGIVLGLGIASMHYTGMFAMVTNMTIRYVPSLFIFSILIAIFVAEAALFLMYQSNKVNLYQIPLKIICSLIMGAAITGMHFTAMWAAIFLPQPTKEINKTIIHPETLSFYVATATILIMGIALVLTHFKRIIGILHKKNEDLQAVKTLLEQKATELSHSKNKFNELNAQFEKLLKQRTIELKTERDAAIESNQSKLKFLEALSQEIKNPINSILAFSELLSDSFKERPLSSQSQKYLNSIHASGLYLSALLIDFLDLSKLETGAMPIYKEEIPLNNFVEDIYEKKMTLALKKNSHFFLHYDSRLPEIIFFDGKKLERILNAILTYVLNKHGNQVVRFYALKEEENFIFKILIENSLVTEEEREHLFDFSFQKKLVHDKESHFLGLILAKKFIELLQGKLSIYDEEHKKMVFAIKFPY